MSDPKVCAVLLTADRPEYARRAVECFRAQTYQNKRIVVFQEFSRATFEPEIFAGLHVDYFRGDSEGHNRENFVMRRTQWVIQATTTSSPIS